MSSEQVKLTGVTPILKVKNVATSIEHYVNVLGFEKAWSWSDDIDQFDSGRPTFACVCRGDVAIFLGEFGQSKPGMWMSIFVQDLNDLDAIHSEYVESGAAIVEPPTNKVWGMREMLVEDLDGNRFRIGCASQEEEQE